jgi:hypothetical protein
MFDSFKQESAVPNGPDFSAIDSKAKSRPTLGDRRAKRISIGQCFLPELYPPVLSSIVR